MVRKTDLIRIILLLITISALAGCTPRIEPTTPTLVPTQTPSTIIISYKGVTLPAPRPGGGPIVPPAWLVAGNVAAQGSSGSYVVTMIDKGECCLTEHGDAPPPPLYPDLATATLAADEQAVIVIGAGSIKEFHATVRPWTDEPALYSGAERELKAEAEPAGNATAFVLEPTGEAGDLLLLVSIIFPVDFDPNYPVDNSASYLWRLNPDTEPVTQPASLPARAVYLVQNPGQLSLDDLQTHPEVAVTNSFNERI